jgi:hypothetical protein
MTVQQADRFKEIPRSLVSYHIIELGILSIAYLLPTVSPTFLLYHFSNIGLKSTSLTHPLRPWVCSPQ